MSVSLRFAMLDALKPILSPNIILINAHWSYKQLCHQLLGQGIVLTVRNVMAKPLFNYSCYCWLFQYPHYNLICCGYETVEYLHWSVFPHTGQRSSCSIFIVSSDILSPSKVNSLPTNNSPIPRIYLITSAA